MRILLVLCLLMYSINTFATDDKSMQELFKKYDSLMDYKKTELIEEVFTKKFILESGGKKELIEKIGELPKELVPSKTQMTWKKGHKGEVYLARVKEISKQKKKDNDQEAEFVVVKEDGKLKIDGTLSDGD